MEPSVLPLALQALPVWMPLVPRAQALMAYSVLQVQEELLARMALGECLVLLARRELQVQVAVWRPTRLAVRAELVLALLVLPAALVLLARRELQGPGVRPERELQGPERELQGQRSGQQPWW